MVASLAAPLLAAPADKAAAAAMAQGWMADESSHLAERFHPQIKAVQTFTGFHVVQLEPEGFIVTTDDDEQEPVLVFSGQGYFSQDPENPLWILLNKDVTGRTEHLRQAKARRVAKQLAKIAAPTTAPAADDAVLAAAKQAQDKWAKYRARAAQPAAAQAQFAVLGISSATGTTTNAANAIAYAAPGDPAATAIHIQNITIVDGHIQLTHDANESVSVYSSYDSGQTWQLEDSAIVWPTWTAKRPVQEACCWYRIATDQIYDPLAVELMRHPPPATELPADMIDFASDPGTSPVGSVGTVSDIRVAPLVQSAWNQGTAAGMNCYNYYTPNNDVDGCVATALAQLMRYWQYPTTGIGMVTRTVYVDGVARSATTRGGNGSGGAYTWSSMPLNPAYTAYNAAQWQMIGALCYDAGVGVNMQYSSGSSGAYMYLCADALSSVFKYANAKYVNYPGNFLLPTDSNLAAGCPVLFGISSSGGNGHAIVCDGFGYDSGTMYHHINFGWAGAYNAWYALPYLESPYGFNSIDTIIYNVFPTGTGELLTGRAMTSQGAPVVGASITASASGQNYSGSTDAKGYYAIKVPSARTYSVTAGKTGMNSATRSGVAIGTSGSSASGNATGIDFTLNNNFAIAAVGLTNSVWLRWSPPTNSGLPNNTVYIRTRTDHYPVNSSDGSLVYSGAAQVYEHAGVDTSGSVTNYYTIWGDNGSSYASLGSSVNCASLADPGNVRLLWVRNTGELYTSNLKINGTIKSSAYVTPMQANLNYWKVAAFNDIDGDGVSDVLWTGQGGEVYFWLLNADGTLKSSGFVAAGNVTRNGYWKISGFSDINGDGTADILWTGGSGGELAFCLLNADGTAKTSGMVSAGNVTRSGYWTVSGFNDINGDGTADILWTGGSGELAFCLLNANGTAKTSGMVSAGNVTRSGYWKVAGFSDINGDGTADILWTGGSGGELAFCLLNANGTAKTSGIVSAGNVTRSGYWKVAGFKDINRDGTPDIIWIGSGGETSFSLLNANGTVKSGGSIQTSPVPPSSWTLSGVGKCGR